MTDEMLRIDTGIPGLNEMMEGGFPFPSSILLAGGTGCGKTTFSLQFLFEGAKNGEPGLFFTTLSEPTQWMLRFASRFSFLDEETLNNMVKYVDLGNVLDLADPPEQQVKKIITTIEDNVAKHMPERVVIDPITVLRHRLDGHYRDFLYQLSTIMKNWQTVTLLTGEMHPDEPYPVDVAYCTDGVLLLYNLEQEDGRRKYLEVLKLRGTEHMTGKHAFDINREGVRVQPGLR